MKLTVRRTESGEFALHIDGECVPHQVAMVLIQEPNELTRLVVEFYADTRIDSVRIIGDA